MLLDFEGDAFPPFLFWQSLIKLISGGMLFPHFYFDKALSKLSKISSKYDLSHNGILDDDFDFFQRTLFGDFGEGAQYKGHARLLS